MKAASALLAVLFAAAPMRSHAEPPDVGVRVLAVAAPHRGGAIGVALWYPATTGGTPTLVGDNAVFAGVAARRDAPLPDRALPLVLLSFGGLRTAPDLDAWIAARLAARGFAVAALHHGRPGDARAAVAGLWLKPADLSAALTAVAADPVLAPHVDTRRVATVGFFLGGTAALSLAGVRLDPARFAGSCGDGGSGPDCRWFAAQGLDLATVDAARVGRSNQDPRIAVAIAVDPYWAASLAPASLAATATPVTVLRLDHDAADIDAAVAAAIPGARLETIAGASRYDAFPACKPGGAEILAADGEAALCGDGRGSSRTRVQDALAASIAAALRRVLGAGD